MAATFVTTQFATFAAAEEAQLAYEAEVAAAMAKRVAATTEHEAAEWLDYANTCRQWAQWACGEKCMLVFKH